MGCACEGNGAAPRVYPPDGANFSFVLLMRDGSTTTYGSRLEADAENARTGYQGVVRIAP